MKDIIKQAIKHDFTDLMIVNEDKKTPSKCFWEKGRDIHANIYRLLSDAITLIHLPDGPSAYFKLSSYTPAKKTPVREGWY